jgi:hypothetical protein
MSRINSQVTGQRGFCGRLEQVKEWNVQRIGSYSWADCGWTCRRDNIWTARGRYSWSRSWDDDAATDGVPTTWVICHTWQTTFSSRFVLGFTPLTNELVQKLEISDSVNSFQEQGYSSKLIRKSNQECERERNGGFPKNHQ